MRRSELSAPRGVGGWREAGSQARGAGPHGGAGPAPDVLAGLHAWEGPGLPPHCRGVPGGCAFPLKKLFWLLRTEGKPGKSVLVRKMVHLRAAVTWPVTPLCS